MVYRRPPLSERLFLPVARFAVGVLGRSFDGVQLLEACGRRSGRLRRTPVKVIIVAGERHLGSLFGEAGWVLNLRETPAAALRVGRRTEPVIAVDLSVADRAPVLREYLRLGNRSQIRELLGVADPGAAVPAAAAAAHPVFRLNRRDASRL
jgi:deazaflavin-dependent oxidoreductase (nitroreductase family)